MATDKKAAPDKVVQSATDKIIREAVNQAFCQRVAFMALRVAQAVAGESPDTPNHDNRRAYADKVFRGDDKAIGLTLHVVAASEAVSNALESGTAENVQDLDIENALKTIWDSRSKAYQGISIDLANQMLSRMTGLKNDVIDIANSVADREKSIAEKYSAAMAPKTAGGTK
jgi:hypothetical protein